MSENSAMCYRLHGYKIVDFINIYKFEVICKLWHCKQIRLSRALYEIERGIEDGGGMVSDEVTGKLRQNTIVYILKMMMDNQERCDIDERARALLLYMIYVFVGKHKGICETLHKAFVDRGDVVCQQFVDVLGKRDGSVFVARVKEIVRKLRRCKI